MKFDEYLQDEFTPKRLPSAWVTNTKFVFQSDDGSLAILDTANDSVTTLVTNHTMVSDFDMRLISMHIN
jgi:inactive dipeptidyl peptidase 10